MASRPSLAIALGHQAARRAAAITVVILAVVVLAVLVSVSPLALGLVSGATDQWDRLSLIGQTYGAASALLAALALAGIVVSLVLQVREYRASREQALRAVHNDLLKMAMDDPLYRRSWGPFFASGDPDRQREHMYVNLIISNMQMRWELKAVSEQHLRASAGVVLSGAAGRRFWSTVRELRAQAVSGRRERRFHEILEEEYALAEPVAEEATPEAPSTRTIPLRVLVVAGVAGTMGAAAVCVLWRRMKAPGDSVRTR